MASYIELNTGFPRERAQITVRPEGAVDVVLGTLWSGQGHATRFAEFRVKWPGVDLSEANLLTGDTDLTVGGGGTHSARALRLAAVVMAKASDQIVATGKRIAARLSRPRRAADIELSARRFNVKGTDRSVDLSRQRRGPGAIGQARFRPCARLTGDGLGAIVGEPA